MKFSVEKSVTIFHEVRRNSYSIAPIFAENIGRFGKLKIIGLDQGFLKQQTIIMYLAKLFYQKILKKPPPYYADYSLLTIIWKPLRKYLNVVVIPNIPFNNIRIQLYRLIGFNIGKNVFIGMKCYLDDIDPKQTTIEDKVVISYGCYFACHGKEQEHTVIHIKENAYIGMRCNFISGKKGLLIGKNTIIGAGSLVNKNIPNDKLALGVPIKIVR